MRTINVTEFARKLRQVLDQVEFKGEEIAVVRNNHQIARIVPGAAHQTALEAMGDLYRTLPHAAGVAWVEEGGSMGGMLDEIRDPWAS